MDSLAAEQPVVAPRGELGLLPDYREWMAALAVERLERLPFHVVPYYRLRAHRADGVYAVTVLDRDAGGPPFKDALGQLGRAIEAGPASPAWMGGPLG